MIIFLIIFIVLFYAVMIEPNLIAVKNIRLKNDSIKNLKIVFVSDFHLSPLAKNRLDKIIKKVNEQNADIVIFGGDYVIAHSAKRAMDVDLIAEKISQMKSKYGIYSVLGNHDYFKDGSLVKNALVKNGITVLENSNEAIKYNGQEIYIAGISDMQTTHYNLYKALLGAKRPVILVSHSPDIMPQAKNQVDLILSGHTHGGQVRIPFFGAVIVPSKYGKKYEYGFFENKMFVSKGLGTSIFRMRFNCLPEIVVIEYEP